MPVRKIPKNYLSVTGSFSSKKNGRMMGFESLLERDFMIQLEFDDTVASFEEQPVRIPVLKTKKSYVPDLLIHYATPAQGKREQPPLLVEVKHTSDLDKHRSKYAPKFEAGQRYAQNRNWNFRTVTEKDIRSTRLKNYKFLREYLRISPEPGDIELVLGAIGKSETIPLNILLQKLCTDKAQLLHLVPVIWHLVATEQIHADLDDLLTDKTLLSIPKRSRA